MTDFPPVVMTPALEQALIAKITEETRKEKALADKEESLAAYHKLSSIKSQRSDAQDLLSSYYHHEYQFFGEVCFETVAPCLATLAMWHRAEPGQLSEPDQNGNRTVLTEGCPMTIIMDSPGGSAGDGFHLFDQIYHYSLRGGGTHKVTIIVRGEAYSMAGILLQAADERVMGNNSQLMIHQVSTWAGGSTGDMEDIMEHLYILNDQVIDSFMSRAKGLTRDEFIEGSPTDKKLKGWKRRNWFLTAEQAVAYGFADRVG